MSTKRKATRSLQRDAPFFVVQYNAHRVLVAPPTDFGRLQLSIRRYFPEIPVGHDVSYWTKDLEICEGSLTEVSSDIWGAAIPVLSKLTVQSAPKVASGRKRRLEEEDQDDECPSCEEGLSNALSPLVSKKPRVENTPRADSTNRSGSYGDRIVFRAVTSTGEEIYFNVHRTTQLGKLYNAIGFKLGKDPDSIGMHYEGRYIPHDSPSLTPEELGMEDNDAVDLTVEQVGGKPVIYLLPPSDSEVEATVKLSLVKEWTFSAVYPAVPVIAVQDGGQTLEWNVNAVANGTLLEKNTGLEVSYLFWEAQTRALPPRCPLSPHPSPLIQRTGDSELEVETGFVPTQAQLDATNSVVLEVAKVSLYLDGALKDLGLHTEARTSFITYWLPSFLKHKYVALRFLPQEAYEKAAPLDVSPAPDLTVRIFMLFKGLEENDVQRDWSAAVAAAQRDTSRWRRVVGVEDRSLEDTTLFRVLEWGGMEVLS